MAKDGVSAMPPLTIDEIAVAAMQGLIVASEDSLGGLNWESECETIADWAYDIAESMVAEGRKRRAARLSGETTTTEWGDN